MNAETGIGTAETAIGLGVGTSTQGYPACHAGSIPRFQGFPPGCPLTW